MLACSNTVGSVRLEQSITWFQVVGKVLPKAGDGEQGEERSIPGVQQKENKGRTLTNQSKEEYSFKIT